MFNQQEIIVKILNTAPYQLPPIIHSGGLYQLDVTYRGKTLHKVCPNLEQCLEGYWYFVVSVNDRTRFRTTDFDKVPVPMGSTVPVQYTTDRPHGVVKETEVNHG